jgi:hypothetical protein
MRKSLVQALLPPVIAALFLAVLIGLGKAARDALHGSERSTIAFADIDCPPPPRQGRADFLGEVQYLGDLPDRVNVRDDGLAERLAAAFAKHPWVKKVERVEVTPPGRVRVQVVFRTPVLAVAHRWEGKGKDDPFPRMPSFQGDDPLAGARAVDAEGVLLPPTAPLAGLPILFDKTAPPSGPAGAPWGDPAVEAAARTAGFLHPYRDRLHVNAIDTVDGDIVLSGLFTFRVLWGSAPGAEKPEEATAAQKIERLLDYCARHGDLGLKMDEPQEHDVRPRDQAIHRPLPRPPS